MARSNRSGGRRSRGRARGMLVREVAYATPITEPANFVEFNMRFNAISLTWGDVQTAFKSVVNGANVQKWRVSSVVVDPVTIKDTGTSSLSGVITQSEVHMGWTGDRYNFSDVNKPLRMRFSKNLGSNGQWMPNTLPTVTAAATNSPLDSSSFMAIDVPGADRKSVV